MGLDIKKYSRCFFPFLKNLCSNFLLCVCSAGVVPLDRRFPGEGELGIRPVERQAAQV